MHSLHHKSYNPTAFSGTNMHPVEATLYYTAALIPVSLGLHPVQYFRPGMWCVDIHCATIPIVNIHRDRLGCHLFPRIIPLRR